MINISNSDIYYKPYPYILFKDVFDANFYNLLCSEFPKTNELLKLDFDKKKNEYKQDKYFLTNLNKGFFQLINKKKNTKYLYEFLKSPLFLNQLINYLNNNNLRIKYNLNSGIVSKFKKLIFKKTDFTFEFSSMSSKNGFNYYQKNLPNRL